MQLSESGYNNQDRGINDQIIHVNFGSRPVAWADNAGLHYLEADHLSSTQGELNAVGAETSQRRTDPFGADRAVAGAADLATEDRYTGQHRADTGNGNARRELYHYGARAYLPGVGLFTQPDTIVPDFKNPQAFMPTR